MTQPQFVPVTDDDKVRPADKLPVPDSWEADRPAEINDVHQPTGPLLGSTGPDQGYAIKLAKHLASSVQLSSGEHLVDVQAGCLGVALKRASLFGRAPVVYDVELAYTLWGFLGDAPADLVEYRKPLFEAASHHYESQRAIADAVPEATLRKTPADVKASLGEWKSLIINN